MVDVVEQHREKLVRHAQKDLPTSDLAAILIEIADKSES